MISAFEIPPLFRLLGSLSLGLVLSTASIGASAQDPELTTRLKPYIGQPLAVFIEAFGPPRIAAPEPQWHWEIASPESGQRGLPSPTVQLDADGRPSVSGGAGTYIPPSFRRLPCDISASVDAQSIVRELHVAGPGCMQVVTQPNSR